MHQPSDQALDVLSKRYFRPGEDWSGMCHRVAGALARGEQEAARFYEVLSEAYFLPNTPCLINAGKPNPQMMACFVLPVGDSIEEIFDSVKHTALIHKTGGGTGFNFSHLRPEGSMVQKTGGIASGPVSFMKVFDAATQQMKQGGVRRGANMGMLSIEHPDIVKFIRCKSKDGEINNFNISVAITDRFMSNLVSNPEWTWMCNFDGRVYGLQYPTGEPIDLTGEAPEAINTPLFTTLNIWELIIHHAWVNGEPGVVFIDKIYASNGKEIESINPCGEQPLEAYEACCLGSIDVSKLVTYDRLGEPKINYELLMSITTTAVDFLNRVVDTSVFPIPQIGEKVRQNRKVGLGIMGWADLLLKMGIAYSSNEAIDLAEKVWHFVNTKARARSEAMHYGNKTITTIAPTGSISIIAGCSSGIEPNYDWTIVHRRKDFPDTTTIHPLAKPYLDNKKELPDYFVTAKEITSEWHVNMQAAFQNNTDNAVSKTINLPGDAKEEFIGFILQHAYLSGCKGLTIYRDGSREDQILSSVSGPKVKSDPCGCEVRPYVVDSKTFKVQIDLRGKLENVYITIGLSPKNKKPFEVFVHGNIRDVDLVVANYIDTTTRLLSLSMRGGVPLEKVIEQLEKIPSTMIYSLPVKIANILREFLPAEGHGQCPNCQSAVVFSEGCVKCTSCEWSKCG